MTPDCRCHGKLDSGRSSVEDIAKSLKFSPQRNFTFSFSIRLAYFLGSTKKVFFCSISNAVFNIVKINFSSKFLHGTPYSNANFSPREFQAKKCVTVKVLS